MKGDLGPQGPPGPKGEKVLYVLPECPNFILRFPRKTEWLLVDPIQLQKHPEMNGRLFYEKPLREESLLVALVWETVCAITSWR